MSDSISVFYANIKDAAEKSGKSIADVLEEAKKAGVSALDLDYGALKNGIPEEIEKSGFKINSLYAFFDFSDPAALTEAKKASDLAASLGAVMMYVPELLGEENAAILKSFSDRNSVFAFLDSFPAALLTAKALEELAVYCSRAGIAAAVENFDSSRSLTERKTELLWLFSRAPHLKFNLDTGNSAPCGEDILELFREFGNKTVNVHCKDRFEKKENCFPVAPVGKGTIPIAQIKSSLIKNGYKGRFSVEVFGVDEPLAAILSSAEYLNTAE